jgi:hypothetical protein
MVGRRFYLIFFAFALFVSVLHAERARNDHLQDDEIDFADEGDVIETIKRFLKGKTTTQKPSSDAISALLTTTPSSKIITPSTKASVFDGLFNKKSSTTSTVASRFDRTRSTTASPKNACGVISPCKNGGTCKTLSSGKYYCFCTQDYYGKTCENSK